MTACAPHRVLANATTGSISLGMALVAGRKRVPTRPGNNALQIGFMGLPRLSAQQRTGGTGAPHRISLNGVLVAVPRNSP